MYKGIPFERRPLDDVLHDVKSAAEFYGTATRWVFLGDSNSLVVKREVLESLLEVLHNEFPRLERVTSYARAKTLARKDPKELRRLRDSGLVRLHVGLETGDADILTLIQKGATPDDMVEAGHKAKEAGFELSLYVLLRIGGRVRWQEHADATAMVLNTINPTFIRVRTLTPQPGSSLFDLVVDGQFSLSPPELILEEERRLIAGLDVTSEFVSDHISNYCALNGQFPEDQKRLLRMLDERLDAVRKDHTVAERYERKRQLRRL